MKPTLTRTTIEHLLNRFMDGETTLAEEQLLADYFRQTDATDDDWQDYREMFAFFDRGMRPEEGAGAENDRRKPGWRRWAVAAMLALLIGSAATLWHRHDATQPAGIAKAAEKPKDIAPQKEPEAPTEAAAQPASQTPKKAVRTAHAARKATPHRRKTAKAASETTTAAADEPAAQEAAEAMSEDILWRKAVIIEAALRKHGYMPVMQEDGSIGFEKVGSPAAAAREPVSI